MLLRRSARGLINESRCTSIGSESSNLRHTGMIVVSQKSYPYRYPYGIQRELARGAIIT
jgi:hypothetical protein